MLAIHVEHWELVEVDRLLPDGVPIPEAVADPESDIDMASKSAATDSYGFMANEPLEDDGEAGSKGVGEDMIVLIRIRSTKNHLHKQGD